jgi:hypothetical protein
MFRFLLASFQRLIFGGQVQKLSPSLLWRVLVLPTKYIHPKPLWALPNPSLWGSCDLWEILSGGLRESSLWALEHLIFVKQSLWNLFLLEVKPPRWLAVSLELPSVWWVLGMFVKVRFASERKEARTSEVRNVVERDPTWSLPCVQLMLPQRRRRDHRWWFRTLSNKSLCQLFGLPSCVLAIQIAWVINCLYWFYRLHA